MGFYLRKSFRMGPVRLNLSKSGLGLSGGVTGARLGVNSRGRAYVHGGRHGLYYRKHLSGKGATRRQAEQSGCGSMLMLGGMIVLGLLGLVLILEHSWILVIAGLAGAIYGGRRFWKRQRLSRCKQELDRILVTTDQVPVPSEIAQLKAACNDSGMTQTLRQDVYQAVLDRVLDDGLITEAEQTRLSAAREVMDLEDSHLRELHRELFTSAWMEAVADHHISTDEVEHLVQLMDGLGIDREEVREELETVNDIIEAQNLTPPLPEVDRGEFDVHLQQSETLHAAQPAQVLSRRGHGESVSWRVHRDGTLLLTDKRLLVVGEGTTQLRLDDLTDVEVDLDQGLLVLHKHGITRPTWIQTDQPFRVGRIVELLMEEM
ncbi:MAG: DUF4236 domain-containing protein [Kiritimatiellae bacterium]|jgi:hypothetical protein|nr:DUF4236 domain-containing protein [Kiritimatiellia bacterium]